MSDEKFESHESRIGENYGHENVRLWNENRIAMFNKIKEENRIKSIRLREIALAERKERENKHIAFLENKWKDVFTL